MNPQEINRRIAIACGWTDTEIANGMYGQTQIPNYHGDLNAMHEAEHFGVSTGMFEASVYRTILFETSSEYAYWNATAAQRAEAFLRTIGQWEEEQMNPITPDNEIATPRCEAERFEALEGSALRRDCVKLSFARQLERELAEKTSEVARLKEMVMEAARRGDEMAAHWKERAEKAESIIKQLHHLAKQLP